jgi:hypothetical protein
MYPREPGIPTGSNPFFHSLKTHPLSTTLQTRRNDGGGDDDGDDDDVLPIKSIELLL